MKDDERTSITSGEGVSCLLLQDITPDDSGKYDVCVENVYGADCHYASVSVEGKFQPNKTTTKSNFYLLPTNNIMYCFVESDNQQQSLLLIAIHKTNKRRSNRLKEKPTIVSRKASAINYDRRRIRHAEWRKEMLLVYVYKNDCEPLVCQSDSWFWFSCSCTDRTEVFNVVWIAF